MFDRKNEDTKWADAIAAEMMALDKIGVWEFHDPNWKPPTDYQFAPLHMVFDLKTEDLRRKARLVVGGNVVDSSMYESCASVVHSISVKLVLLVAKNQGLKIMAGDVRCAFPHAPTKEKVYTRAGPEFGDKQGCMIVITSALYGFVTACHAWNVHFGDKMREMNMIPSRADPNLWLKRNEINCYDYIPTHVDDFFMAAFDPQPYMDTLMKSFVIRHPSSAPEKYLGNDMDFSGEYTKVSCKTYITEMLRKYQKDHQQLKTSNIPAKPGDHPELDVSPLLGDTETTEFQHILGMTQWLKTSGRIDMCFFNADLNRFQCAPREGHLERARKGLGFLKKYSSKGYYIDPRPPIIDNESELVTTKEVDFGNQYRNFKEEIDPKFPEPLCKEMEVNIFVDSNHGHDKVTGKSLTGVIAFVGRTPVDADSKRQPSCQAATYGSEYLSLRKGVEKAVTVRYYLRSMGVKVTKPTRIWGDNRGTIVSSTTPGSALKNKMVALSYHTVREHYAGKVIDICYIGTDDNYADPMTKAVPSSEFHGHFGEFLYN